MNKFVDLMDELSSNVNQYKYITFTYHTSHTLEFEIMKYSIIDTKLIGIFFVFFWFVFFLLMAFDFERFDLQMFWKRFKNSDDTMNIFVKFFASLKSLLTDSSSKYQFNVPTIAFLVVINFLQFVITSLSTLGLMSLLGFVVNQLLYSIVFVLLSKFSLY